MLYPKEKGTYTEKCISGLKEEIRKSRMKTKGIIGVNVMVALSNYADMVRTAINEKIDVIFSGAGLPLDLPSYLTTGSITKLVPIVSSSRAAKIICDKWQKNYNYLPDTIVVEGPKAGGHLGFTKEQLQDIPGMHYEEEVERILKAVKAYGAEQGKEIPVVMAGGIYTGEEAAYWISRGLQGVQMATRFVTTEECDAHPAFKQTYIDAGEEDIVLVKSPVGMPGRAIRNAFLERAEKGPIPHGRCFGCIKTCKPADTPYCITEALIRAVEGDVENGLLFCGSNACRSDKIEKVEDILGEVADALK